MGYVTLNTPIWGILPSQGSQLIWLTCVQNLKTLAWDVQWYEKDPNRKKRGNLGWLGPFRCSAWSLFDRAYTTSYLLFHRSYTSILYSFRDIPKFVESCKFFLLHIHLEPRRNLTNCFGDGKLEPLCYRAALTV